jgi:large subunit ribosomal protein L24e
MVITLNTCTFSEYKIYPGRGIKFITRDCKVHFFINKKCVSFFKRKTKAVKLNWTQAWRRYFQKSKAEQAVKKRVKRRQKIQKAIEGLSLESIQKMKTSEEKVKMRDQVSKEVKERQRKLMDSKKKKTADQPKKAAQKAPVTKAVKGPKKI